MSRGLGDDNSNGTGGLVDASGGVTVVCPFAWAKLIAVCGILNPKIGRTVIDTTLFSSTSDPRSVNPAFAGIGCGRPRCSCWMLSDGGGGVAGRPFTSTS